MPDAVEVVRDDEYEEFAMSYQCVLIAMLERALRRSGLEPERARKVVNRFMFELGDFHDHGWLKSGGDRLYPLLCFTRQFLNVDTDVRTIGTIYAPSAGFAFHEHALGTVEAYFSDDPSAQVETGSFGEPADE